MQEGLPAYPDSYSESFESGNDNDDDISVRLAHNLSFIELIVCVLDCCVL